jgi:hypothetical protein
LRLGDVDDGRDLGGFGHVRSHHVGQLGDHDFRQRDHRNDEHYRDDLRNVGTFGDLDDVDDHHLGRLFGVGAGVLRQRPGRLLWSGSVRVCHVCGDRVDVRRCSSARV